MLFVVVCFCITSHRNYSLFLALAHTVIFIAMLAVRLTAPHIAVWTGLLAALVASRG